MKFLNEKSRLKRKLNHKEISMGSWLTFPSFQVVEIMASAGFEWLVIDLEHTALDYHQAAELIAHIQGNDMQALVRIGSNDELMIKKVLDAGAEGIIVPMIKSKEEAKKIIDFVKYPPKGKRGVGLNRAQNYGIGFNQYKKWLEEEVIIVFQIEHIEAVNQLPEILSVEGCDGIIVGPYDLSASMGHPGEYHRDEVKQAIDKIDEVCKQKNIAKGYHVIETEPEYIAEKVKSGFTFLAYSIDFLFLGNTVREKMTKLKEKLK